MEIEILAFGQIADITGKSSIKLSGVNNTGDLTIRLVEMYPALSALKYSIAVNKKLVQVNTILTNADVVALLPPFSGG